MKHAVANELVMRLYRATGLPVMGAKKLLAEMPEEEQQRYTHAAEHPKRGIVRDPIEDDPEFRAIISCVLKSVAEQVQKEHDADIEELEKTSPDVADVLQIGHGLCHRIWHLAKLQLKQEHGIEWKSPAEMTPWAKFD